MRVHLSLFAFMTIACADKDSAGDDTGSSTSCVESATGDSANGATAYASKCAGCHGADGTGVSGPDLTSGLVTGMSDELLACTIADGVGGMPPITSDPQEVADLVAYLRSEFN